MIPNQFLSVNRDVERVGYLRVLNGRDPPFSFSSCESRASLFSLLSHDPTRKCLIILVTFAMTRRSAPSNSGPAFIPHNPQRRAIVDPNESAFSRFMREQIWAPDKKPGNLKILTAVGMFAGGIAVARAWGDLLIPA